MDNNKKGVAIEFSGDIPKILAVAKGILLEKLLEIAKKHQITVYKDADLTEFLSKLPIGSEIPEDLYKAVAEVLAYCYRINTDFKNKVDTLGTGHV